MGDFEATVEPGGVLHVPYPEGTPVTVKPKKFADYTREEWVAFVNDFAGSAPDFEVPERLSSRSIPSFDVG